MLAGGHRRRGPSAGPCLTSRWSGRGATESGGRREATGAASRSEPRTPWRAPLVGSSERCQAPNLASTSILGPWNAVLEGSARSKIPSHLYASGLQSRRVAFDEEDRMARVFPLALYV